MTVYAHTSHWLINLLYAGPLVAVVFLLIRGWLRHRGAPEVTDGEPPPGEDGAGPPDRATD